MRRTYLLLLINLSIGNCWSQVTFEPPSEPKRIPAVRTAGAITVDGVMDEASWFSASEVTEFIQKDPVQGSTATMPTMAKILFDNDY